MERGPATRVARALAWTLLLSAACVSMVGANPAPDPSAFSPFPTLGLALAPAAFVSGNTSYTFTLYPGAYLVYGGTQYPITDVWAFYAVNKTDSGPSDFTAAGSDTGEWKWDQKPNGGSILSVGGWLDAPKKEALETPISGSVSRTFSYSQFSFAGATPVLGLHVSVSIPDGKPSPFGSGVTGSIIPVAIPEPAAVVALLGGLAGLVLRRRG